MWSMSKLERAKKSIYVSKFKKKNYFDERHAIFIAKMEVIFWYLFNRSSLFRLKYLITRNVEFNLN